MGPCDETPPLLLLALLAPEVRGDATLPARGARPETGIYWALPPANGETRLLVMGEGRAIARGERLQVLDRRGPMGVVEATADPAPACISPYCPASQAWARWVGPPRRPTETFLFLVGPIDRPLGRARLLAPPAPDGQIHAVALDPDGSATVIAIDLDGDGRADLETRARSCPDDPFGMATCYEDRRRTGERWQVIARRRFDRLP
jgi:hypothetical protein